MEHIGPNENPDDWDIEIEECSEWNDFDSTFKFYDERGIKAIEEDYPGVYTYELGSYRSEMDWFFILVKKKRKKIQKWKVVGKKKQN